MKVKLLKCTPDPELLCAAAMMTSYKGEGTTKLLEKLNLEKARKTIRRIMGYGHYSAIEHATFTFSVEGVSRSLTHQLVRHRIASYCLDGDTIIYGEWPHITKKRGPTIDGFPRNCSAKKWKLRDLYYKWHYNRPARLALQRAAIRCFDEHDGLFVACSIQDVVYSGVRPVFKVELEDGKAIICSADHRFLTPKGWMTLREAVGLSVTANGVAYWKTLDNPIVVNGKTIHQDEEWLCHKYHVEGLSQEQMASLAGVTKHCIRKWIRKYGLQKPLGSWSMGKAPWNKGKHYSLGAPSFEHRLKLSLTKMGPHNPAWKGGVTREAVKIRRPILQLREYILRRDGYRCRLCGNIGGKLTLHHIVPIWVDKSLAQDHENICMLCKPCHNTVNGHELEYISILRPAIKISEEIKSSTDYAKRKRTTRLRPKLVKIKGITYLGERDTYDLIMKEPHHNFVANGIVVHNSQQSQRYVAYSTLEHYVTPRSILEKEEAKKIYDDTLMRISDGYQKLLNCNIPKEDARFILPNAAKTNILVTMNARELHHFFNLRCCERSQWEIRELATEMLKQAKGVAPALFENAGPSCVKLGYCPEGELKEPTCRIEEIKKRFQEL
ncbi:MAG: FAD-dependent thymidylate synthase [Candidatus Bathyarchaeota archaeon BA1]|nr:MAG: FAD-dependent thymidylate synthase [Candidatus Bathyarchaeota archaeon BA1]